MNAGRIHGQIHRCLMILPALVWIGSLAQYAAAQGPVYAVMISHRVTNISDAPAEDVTAVCVLPATNRYQEVIDLHIDPEPEATRQDTLEQPVITVRLGDLAPGQSRAVRVLVWTRLRTVRVNLLAPSGPPTTLPADVEAGQLADGALLALDRVRPIAREHAGKATSELERARAAFAYMARTCVYDIDETFASADRILAGEPASCSELAWTYTALCRALDIPARIVSAYANRQGISPSTDWRTHRWVEFYAKGYGWVPADPTNHLNDTTRSYFGFQDPKYLTVIDDGVSSAAGPYPGWRVFLATSKQGHQVLSLSRSAVWRVSVQRRLEQQRFTEACEALRSEQLETRRAAVTAWPRQRDPLAHGYLLEALFDTDLEIRKAAAAALGESRDTSMLIPLALMAAETEDAPLKQTLLTAAQRLLRTPDARQRAEAVAELARSRTDEALELLDGIWNDPAREVRKAAAQTLYKFGSKPLVDEGYRLLVNDADDYIRAIAALRWSRTGTRAAEPFLVELLESPVRWDREQALAALMKISGDSFSFDPSASPGRRSNQEALARWRTWLDARQALPDPVSPQASSGEPVTPPAPPAR